MLLLSFPLPFFLFIGAGKLRWARWMIPMLPFLALFAGYCLCLLVDWGHRFFKLASRVRAGSLLVVVAVVVAFPSGYASARWGYQLAHKDTSEALPQTAELMAHGLTQIDTDRMSI